MSFESFPESGTQRPALQRLLSGRTLGDSYSFCSDGSAIQQWGPGLETNAARTRHVILLIVARVAYANKSFYRCPCDVRAAFGSVQVPEIPLDVYGERLSMVNRNSRTVWLLMYTFLNRACTHGNVVLSAHNVHRLVLCSLLLALKSVGEAASLKRIVSQVAEAGGVSCAELNEMEQAFLTLTSWRLHFGVDELTHLAESLVDLEAVAERSAQLAREGALLHPVTPIPVQRQLGPSGRAPQTSAGRRHAVPVAPSAALPPRVPQRGRPSSPRSAPPAASPIADVLQIFVPTPSGFAELSVPDLPASCPIRPSDPMCTPRAAPSPSAQPGQQQPPPRVPRPPADRRNFGQRTRTTFYGSEQPEAEGLPRERTLPAGDLH